MARGRRPEPAAVKIAKGNPGKRRVADAPDLGAVGAIKPPAAMGTGARNIWRDMAPELQRLKFLRATDVQAFARYCEHLYDWWSLTKSIRKDGRKYLAKSDHNPEGIWRTNPDVRDRERVEKQLVALEDRFGLSPAARQQILQRLALIGAGALLPSAAPSGDLLDGQQAHDVPPPPPASPIGMLSKPRNVH
ncbi:phage terminase small subunit P27 family [Niveispirillum sp.]|uniref:phage terminase small subunit P27 family n=1 Tax=Niveispirillum sp. TaxID=1917217 RepID=UPI001B4C8382|nr:phage terminase small subunit P27 family [Niveispirillum sp.]MBP7339104.1 phage terminase small subunit P27 family [Niveispirillum sp.]